MGDNMLPHAIWDGVYGGSSGFQHLVGPMLEELNKYGIDFETWAHNCLNQDDLEDAVANLNKHRAGYLEPLMPQNSNAEIMSFLEMAAADEPMTQAQAWVALSAIPYLVDEDYMEWEILEWMLNSCPGIAWRTFRPDSYDGYGSTQLCIWSQEDLRERYGGLDTDPLRALINLRRGDNRV